MSGGCKGIFPLFQLVDFERDLRIIMDGLAKSRFLKQSIIINIHVPFGLCEPFRSPHVPNRSRESHMPLAVLVPSRAMPASIAHLLGKLLIAAVSISLFRQFTPFSTRLSTVLVGIRPTTRCDVIFTNCADGLIGLPANHPLAKSDGRTYHWIMCTLISSRELRRGGTPSP